MDLNHIFKTANPIIGVVHLLPLPASPRWGGSLKAVIDRAEQEATALASGGVDGIIVENFFDAPFAKDRVDPAVVRLGDPSGRACFTSTSAKILTSLPSSRR